MIDNHCHPFDLEPGLFDLRRAAIDLSEMVTDTAVEPRQERMAPLWRAVLRSRLAERLEVAVDDLDLARAEAVRDYRSYVGGLFSDAGITDLVMDPSWPPGSADRVADFASLSGCRVHPVLRLESIIDPLLEQRASFGDVMEGLDGALSHAYENGYRALKSAVAYRTGLAIVPDVSEQAARMSLSADGPAHRQAKPLRDFVLRRVLRFAADQGLPVQIHTGFGDSDLRLGEANPLLLEELLRTPEGSAAQIVLLHGGFPFQEEAAFLSAARPNVLVDLSLMGVFAPAALAEAIVRVAGLAPPDRIVAGTDGYGLPEVFWLSAILLREAWQQASVRFRQLGADSTWVKAAGDAIFEGNGRRLYRLDEP
ncbi:MAG: amidohydrolase family protein [Acidimicrobiia bacterium]